MRIRSCAPSRGPCGTTPRSSATYAPIPRRCSVASIDRTCSSRSRAWARRCSATPTTRTCWTDRSRCRTRCRSSPRCAARRRCPMVRWTARRGRRRSCPPSASSPRGRSGVAARPRAGPAPLCTCPRRRRRRRTPARRPRRSDGPASSAAPRRRRGAARHRPLACPRRPRRPRRMHRPGRPPRHRRPPCRPCTQRQISHTKRMFWIGARPPLCRFPLPLRPRPA